MPEIVRQDLSIANLDSADERKVAFGYQLFHDERKQGSTGQDLYAWHTASKPLLIPRCRLGGLARYVELGAGSLADQSSFSPFVSPLQQVQVKREVGREQQQ